MQERIASVGDASVTAIEAVYVPADDFTDPAVTTIAAHVDSMVVLSRAMSAEGMYPAVDPIASSSILLDPLVVGDDHVAVATETRRAIEHYRELQDVIALLGMEELGAEDRRIVERARRLQRFLTQPFAVTEAFTGVPGRSVPVADTVAGCRAILAGDCDDWRESSLYMVGALDEARAKEEARAPRGAERHKAGARRAMGRGLQLMIATPATLLIDVDDVRSLRAEDDSGAFGVLPGHADLLTVLPPSVVRWTTQDGATRYCALSGGVLRVAGGDRVAIACRRGAIGDDLSALRAEIEALRVGGTRRRPERAGRADAASCPRAAPVDALSAIRAPARSATAKGRSRPRPRHERARRRPPRKNAGGGAPGGARAKAAAPSAGPRSLPGSGRSASSDGRS